MRETKAHRFAIALGWLITAGMAQADSLPLPLTVADSGNFYLTATLETAEGQMETPMLVDTGSGYVGLSKATFNRIKDDPGTTFARTITGVMANGRAQKVSVYRVSSLQLAQDCTLRDIEVVVFPSGDRDILGLNALKRMESFTLSMDPPQLVAQHCG